MSDFQQDAIGLENAPWWMPGSSVVLKGLFLASDEAWIANKMVSVQGSGANAVVETNSGNMTILKVQRMVQQGTVAVMLKGGARYEVHLPQDAGKLLAADLAWIASRIDLASQPMTAEEQAAFLASAQGPSGES